MCMSKNNLFTRFLVTYRPGTPFILQIITNFVHSKKGCVPFDSQMTEKNNINKTADADAPRVMRVDVNAVLRQKLGQHYRWYMRPAAAAVKRIICQDKLNGILERHGHLSGADFCEASLADLDISVDVQGLENLPDPANRRVIFACNHPLGGPDGLALIKFMRDYYGGDVYVVVNDILMAVEPLRNVFLPVNKHGGQQHDGVRQFDAVLASDNPVLFFPAGLVSRRRGGVIADLPWKKTFISKAIATQRDVIPLFFSGRDSLTFYRFARLRERLGIRFNIEMILLPRQLFRLRGKCLTISCGKPVPWQELQKHKSVADAVADIRRRVYEMAPKSKKIPR